MTHMIGPFWGLWKSFGPFCAPAGRHSLTFTSDSNDVETTVKIVDSFGLVRAQGGMDDFPLEFNTSAPSKFCVPADLGVPTLSEELKKERARKLIASTHQYIPRVELERKGFGVPSDQGYSVIDIP